jgi:hypothetical protein
VAVTFTDTEVYGEKTGQKWYIVHEVCNTGEQATTVVVTEWPWDADGNKIGDEAKSKTVTIPAGECVKVAFDYPSYTHPRTMYSDIWWPGATWREGGSSPFQGDPGYGRQGEVPHDVPNKPKDPKWKTLRPLVGAGYAHVDGRARFTSPVLLMPTDGRPEAIILYPTPYPMRLFTHWGAHGAIFKISSITGIPRGWECDALYPRQGVPFVVPPGELSRQGALRLVAPTKAGAVQECNLRVHQDVVGASQRTPFRHTTEIPVIVLETQSEPSRGDGAASRWEAGGQVVGCAQCGSGGVSSAPSLGSEYLGLQPYTGGPLVGPGGLQAPWATQTPATQGPTPGDRVGPRRKWGGPLED